MGRKQTNETKEKIRNSLTKEPYKKICLNCNEEFETKVKKKKCCSRSCSVSYSNKKKWSNEEYRKEMSEFAINRHKNGEEQFGFQTREKFKMSYPEEIAQRKLDELNLDYQFNLKVGKYFIDFAIKDKMIAIEIDGQQHELPERKKSDERKDNFLKNEGWEIFRIKWPSENIQEHIEKIFKTKL